MSVWTRGVVVFSLGLALAGCGSDEVPVDSPAVSADVRAVCERLVATLPDTVSDQQRRPVDPEDALGAAWGDPAITLTCGVAMPDDFDEFSTCQEANGVGWYIPDEATEDQGADVVMTTVGFEPVVRVQLPARYRPPAAAMVDLAAPLRRTLEQVQPCV